MKDNTKNVITTRANKKFSLDRQHEASDKDCPFIKRIKELQNAKFGDFIIV